MPASQFYQSTIRGRRALGPVIAEARLVMLAAGHPGRDFASVQTLAERLNISGEYLWKMARELGAPPRHDRRAPRLLSEGKVDEAEARLAQGEELKSIADSLGTFPSTLKNRLARREEARDLAELERARERPKARANVYVSQFFSPLTMESLCQGKARPAPTLRASREIPSPAP